MRIIGLNCEMATDQARRILEIDKEAHGEVTELGRSHALESLRGDRSLHLKRGYDFMYHHSYPLLSSRNVPRWFVSTPENTN